MNTRTAAWLCRFYRFHGPNKLIALYYDLDTLCGMPHAVGDKLRIKSGQYAGQRAVLCGRHGATLVVRLASGRTVDIAARAATNYSLAARRAWITAPTRAVGRRKGTGLSNRVSVTLRIDRQIWTRFQNSERAGKIADRTAVINQLLRRKLDALDRRERPVET